MSRTWRRCAYCTDLVLAPSGREVVCCEGCAEFFEGAQLQAELSLCDDWAESDAQDQAGVWLAQAVRDEGGAA